MKIWKKGILALVAGVLVLALACGIYAGDYYRDGLAGLQPLR